MRARRIPQGRGGTRQGVATVAGVAAAIAYTGYQLVVEQKFFVHTLLAPRLGNRRVPRLPLGYGNVIRLKAVMAVQQLSGDPEVLKGYQFAVYERVRRHLDARGVARGSTVDITEYRPGDIDPRTFYRRHVRRGQPAVLRGFLGADVERFGLGELARRFPGALVQALDTRTETFCPVPLEVIDADRGSRFVPQQALVDQDPRLLDYLPIERSRDYFPVLGRRARPVVAFLIIGIGRGLNANLHCEEGPNWYMAVSGTKHWTLIEAEHSFLLYPAARGDGMRRFSEFPAAADGSPADGDRYPLYSYAPRIELDLHPGDALYFPAWTWHKTVNLDDEGLGVTVRYPVAGPMGNRYFRALQLVSPPFWRSISQVVSAKVRGDTGGLEEAGGFNEQELAL
jgi:Cupin-like domain